jgi:hypothetical protein
VGALFDIVRTLSVGSVATLVGAIATLVTFAIQIDRQTRPSPRSPDSAQVADLLVNAGRKLDRPYVLPSVQSWIRLNRNDQDGRFVADQHSTYSLLALRDIAPSENVFSEGYKSDNATLDYLPGTDDVTDLARRDGISWRVPLSMKVGEYRTVVTAVRRNYRAGWNAQHRTDHAGYALAVNQDEFCYPIGDDVIGELVIAVESQTLKFKTPSVGLADPTEGTRVFTVPTHEPAPTKPLVVNIDAVENSVATARFVTPRQSDEACLIVAW